MANEFSLSCSLGLRKGFLNQSRSASNAFNLNAASPAIASGAASVGFAAHQAIAMGSITTAGFAFFQNLDATNYMQIGIDQAGTFVPFLKLKPGEFQLVRLAVAAPYAKANTAAVKLLYEIYDD